MAKKNSVISVEFDNGNLRFAIADAGEFSLTIASLTDDIREKALVHGLTQKISDAAAIAKADLPTDPVEAAKVKFEAMKAVADRLSEGDWSKRAGDGAGPVAGIIFRAFAEFVTDTAKAKKKPVPSEEAIRAVYDAKDRAGQLALRNVPEIATIIERMKSERGAGAAKVDASALLGELGI